MKKVYISILWAVNRMGILVKEILPGLLLLIGILIIIGLLMQIPIKCFDGDGWCH